MEFFTCVGVAVCIAVVYFAIKAISVVSQLG